MKKQLFKDTMYAGRSLSEDLRHPINGRVIIPRSRKLTAYLVRNANSVGVEITFSMLRETGLAGKRNICERIEWLENKISTHEKELASLKQNLTNPHA